MSDNRLMKLKRDQLLEMLIEQSKRVKELEEKLEIAEAELQSRRIAVNHAGSIAEAALQLNGVFEAAQAACGQYTENVETLSKQQKEICDKMEEECRRKCAIMEISAENKCRDMPDQARRESEKYWSEISQRLEKFYAEHTALREILAINPETASEGKQNEEE